jgi:hypothetical protein
VSYDFGESEHHASPVKEQIPDFIVAGAMFLGTHVVGNYIVIPNRQAAYEARVDEAATTQNDLAIRVDFYDRLFNLVNDENTPYYVEELRPDQSPPRPRNITDAKSNEFFNNEYQQVKDKPGVKEVIADIQSGQPLDDINPRMQATYEHDSVALVIAQRKTEEALDSAPILGVDIAVTVVAAVAIGASGYCMTRFVRESGKDWVARIKQRRNSMDDLRKFLGEGAK